MSTPLPGVPYDSGLVEVADRCWVARDSRSGVTVGVVGGTAGLLVVDPLGPERAARAVADLVHALPGRVVGVVNTHEHLDHTAGNDVLAGPGVPVYAHETAAARVTTVTETFSSARVVDLGDRQVELIHPGRGHTGGDCVVRVGDADLLLAGDLVQESTERGGVPGFGEDCFPLEWPGTLDLVVGLLTADSVVVPGHGQPVRKDFVSEQRSAVAVVAETIRGLASRGVPVRDALDAGSWPYPAELLGTAVRRGYAQLPRAARGLPLL